MPYGGQLMRLAGIPGIARRKRSRWK